MGAAKIDPTISLEVGPSRASACLIMTVGPLAVNATKFSRPKAIELDLYRRIALMADHVRPCHRAVNKRRAAGMHGGLVAQSCTHCRQDASETAIVGLSNIHRT